MATPRPAGCWRRSRPSLLRHASSTLSPTETITFADALRAAGRDEAAGRLYVQTADVLVAQRSAGDLAQIIASMTEAGQDDHARRVLSAALGLATTAAAVMPLLAAHPDRTMQSGAFTSPLLPGIPATLADRFLARLIDSR